MDAKAYGGTIINLCTYAHTYYLASGAVPVDDIVWRGMARAAIQAAACCYALHAHHNERAHRDPVACQSYLKLARRWDASARRAASALQTATEHMAIERIVAERAADAALPEVE